MLASLDTRCLKEEGISASPCRLTVGLVENLALVATKELDDRELMRRVVDLNRPLLHGAAASDFMQIDSLSVEVV